MFDTTLHTTKYHSQHFISVLSGYMFLLVVLLINKPLVSSCPKLQMYSTLKLCRCIVQICITACESMWQKIYKALQETVLQLPLGYQVFNSLCVMSSLSQGHTTCFDHMTNTVMCYGMATFDNITAALH